MTAPHPLVASLIEHSARPALSVESLADFLDEPGMRVLFCGGDPVQHPECLDVAVVLPELLKHYPGRCAIAVADRALEPALQASYGIQRWPSLLFLRDGQYVGAIQGMQDWSVYVQRFMHLLEAPASRPPAIGVAIASDPGSHCH
jgi:hydrogenase-1 operon protein HyaE